MARSKQTETQRIRREKLKALKESNSKLKEEKKRRWKSGTVAKREIVKQQRRTNPLIPRKRVQQLVREIVQDTFPGQEFRFEKETVNALREASSSFLADLFVQSSKVLSMIGGETLNLKCMQIGRATMGVECLSDVHEPMGKSLSAKTKTIRNRQLEPVNETSEVEA